MNRLQGKVAVVTGAALGMGRAAAQRMAEEGAAVALLDLHDDEGPRSPSSSPARGFKAEYWHCDVTKEAEVKAAIDAAVAAVRKARRAGQQCRRRGRQQADA